MTGLVEEPGLFQSVDLLSQVTLSSSWPRFLLAVLYKGQVGDTVCRSCELGCLGLTPTLRVPLPVSALRQDLAALVHIARVV